MKHRCLITCTQLTRAFTLIALAGSSLLGHADCGDDLYRPISTLEHLQPVDDVIIVTGEISFTDEIKLSLAEGWRKHAHAFGVKVFDTSFRAEPDGALRMRFRLKGKAAQILGAADYFAGLPMLWSERPQSLAQSSAREILDLLERPIASFHLPLTDEAEDVLARERLNTLGELIAWRAPSKLKKGSTEYAVDELNTVLSHFGLKIGFSAKDLTSAQAAEYWQTRLLDLNLPSDVKMKLAPTSVDTPARFLSMSKKALESRGIKRDDRRVIKATLRTYGLFKK